MSNVIKRKTYVIRRLVTAGTAWTVDFDIDFVPDEMILRQVNYNGDTRHNEVLILCSNLVSSFYSCDDSKGKQTNLTGGMTGFSMNDFVSSQCYFTIGKEVKGAYTFSIMNGLGLFDGSAMTGNVLSFVLEFVKY